MSPAASARPCPPAAPPPDTSDAIGAWLDRLLRLTRLPPRQTAELRDELDAHLRDRARDLMLAGHDEPDAVHKAIAELGDLALLAHRYRDAHRIPKGRLMMNSILVTAVVSALGLSTVALRQTGQAPPAPVAPAQPAQGTALPPLLQRTLPDRLGRAMQLTGQLDRYVLTDNVQSERLDAVLPHFGNSSESRVYVYWSELEQLGAARDAVLDDMPLADQTVEKALGMISDTLGLDGVSRLDYRVENGLMEIATREFFDQREVELVSYDAADLLGADSPLYQSTESEALIQLVITLVEPDVWQANGGFATISAAGNRVFVNAPSRIHTRVAWLLAE
ncbi:MAG TPA: permease prefix domain 1-containing protein, partial [Phycisphaerales bacterium]|nr:permease prefix domain 1-containing protein [Phycisphaerales bacterium]